MFNQLLIGTVVIAISVAIQAEMLNMLSRRFETIIQFCRRHLKRFANTGAIIIAVLYVLLIQTVIVWLWAIVFIVLGDFTSLEPSLYFSLVSFTTVGYGDIVLSEEWRLLSGMTSANGFLSFGWSTAYMVELVRRTT